MVGGDVAPRLGDTEGDGPRREAFLHWLHGITQEALTKAPPFNWLGLGETATFRATSEEASRDERLDWGRIGAAVYDWLARNGVDPANCEFKSMLLRARLIATLGQGRGILDPEPILDWFASRLPGPLDDVRTRARDPRSMASLRELKNRTYVLSVLSNYVPLGPEMRAWVALSRDLP